MKAASSARSVLLTDIEAFSSYSVAVVATNHYGSSQQSFPVSVLTLGENNNFEPTKYSNSDTVV